MIVLTAITLSDCKAKLSSSDGKASSQQDVTAIYVIKSNERIITNRSILFCYPFLVQEGDVTLWWFRVNALLVSGAANSDGGLQK